MFFLFISVYFGLIKGGLGGGFWGRIGEGGNWNFCFPNPVFVIRVPFWCSLYISLVPNCTIFMAFVYQISSLHVKTRFIS